MSFADDVSRWVTTKARPGLLDAQKAVVRLALEGFIERSPVGAPETWKSPPPPGYRPGTFKANWNVSIGAPDLSTRDVQDPTGAGTYQTGLAKIESMQLGDVVFITNSLPYSRRLEYDGWSLQAPLGMVRVTIAGLPAEFQRYVAVHA